MSYNFKNAIIRKPNKSIQNGLSSQNLSPLYDLVFEDKVTVVEMWQELGLKCLKVTGG